MVESIQILVKSAISFCFFYFTLRYLKTFWEKRQLPSWSRGILGVAAWATLLSTLGILWGLVLPIILLFTHPNTALAFLLVGFAMGVGVIAKYANANPELFDFASMKPFLKDSLAFANPTRTWMNLSEEVDKHEVRRVYKEVTGNDLPEDDPRYDRDLKKTLDAAMPSAFSGDRRVRASAELKNVLSEPIASPHLSLELEQLGHRSGNVDISDSWIINRLKRSGHDFFHRVKHVVIDPAAYTMELSLESEDFVTAQVDNQVAFYTLKQSLYDFFQAVNQQEWVQPYLQYVETFVCTCSHYSDEAFLGPKVRPLCRVEIARQVLKAHEGGFFNVGEMKGEIFTDSSAA